MERPKRYNAALMKKITEICMAECDDIQPVDSEFYERFIETPDEGLKAVIRLIVRATADHMNKNILSGEWDDDDILNHVKLFLELVFEGKIQFRENELEICFVARVGEEPTDSQWVQFQERIDAADDLIVEVISKACGG